MEMETKKEVNKLGQMSLLDCPECMAPTCAKCGKNNPGHTKLECPDYKYCGWCRMSRVYGFITRHKCTGLEQEGEASTGWNKHDHKLWSGNHWGYVKSRQLHI